MKLGILGGTFNPIHYGHLILAQEAYEQLDLNKVLFVPTWKPRYKRTNLSFEHRYTMCANALSGDTRFMLTDVECRENISYTVDSLYLLRSLHPADEFHLILGGDQAGQFFVWRSPETILNIVESVVAVGREAYGMSRILDHWGDHRHRLALLDVPPLYPSSTLIRAKVSQNLDIRYLVPPVVEEYIYAEGLYASQSAILEEADGLRS